MAFFFYTNTATKITKCGHTDTKNKICVLNKNVGIHLTLSYQTNSTSVQIRHS